MALTNEKLLIQLQKDNFKYQSSQLTFILENSGYDLTLETLDNKRLADLHEFLSKFNKTAKSKWHDVGRNLSRLRRKFSSWLSQKAEISFLAPPPPPPRLIIPSSFSAPPLNEGVQAKNLRSCQYLRYKSV